MYPTNLTLNNISLFTGAGAISVSGLKTITIRNLALAQRAVQLVVKLIPYIRKHFEQCHSQNRLLKNTNNNGAGAESPTMAESKQLESFRKQFEQVIINFLPVKSTAFCSMTATK